MIASHEWEAVSPGGAQRSAGALAMGLSAVPGVEVTLASAIRESPDTAVGEPSSQGRPFDEVLVQSETDFEFYSWIDPSYARNWAQVLTDVRPDVVHLHHYYHLGVELPRLVRHVLPEAAIVMTLHEFLAICLQSGQMVDGSGHLCLGSSPTACAQCVGWPVDRTFARQDYIRRGLASVDVFVTPSEFARQRYLDWGLGSSSVRLIPNALELERRRERPAGESVDRGLRLAFIGQHTPFKGLAVLLEAVARIREQDPGVLERLDVYGGGADRFGEDFERHLRGLIDDGAPVVRTHGPYGQGDLTRILDDADAIVVPSTWWENSPVVIEEALARRVPVICSDIGGMAEKVRDGVDGWHFQAGNSASLAEQIVRLSLRGTATPPGMRRPLDVSEVVDLHLAAYRDALSLAAHRTSRG